MNISGEEDAAIADGRPEVRVTQVVFYDQIGHVVPFDFDPDILSRGLEIYLSGFFKMLTDDDPLSENGIPVTQVGPLCEWWISGYGTGENIVLGVSTETAHYYLTAPNEIYAPVYDKIKEKAFLSKVRLPLNKKKNVFTILSDESKLKLQYLTNSSARGYVAAQ